MGQSSSTQFDPRRTNTSFDTSYNRNPANHYAYAQRNIRRSNPQISYSEAQRMVERNGTACYSAPSNRPKW